MINILDLWEEEDQGVKPVKVYQSLIKKSLLKRYDCWRTYKYKNTSSLFQIKYHFKTKPLSKIYDTIFLNENQQSKKILKKVSVSQMYNILNKIKINED
mgnify:FL=1